MANMHLYSFALTICSCFVGLSAFSKAVDDTALRLYFRNNTYIQVNAANATLLVPHLNLTEKTLLHCHGYEQSTDSETVKKLINDYLLGFTYNIIAIDYRNISTAFYPTAVLLSNSVAEVVANSIIDMRNAGVREEQFLLTGFSLGGQIVGAIGRNLNFTLPEIIAIEPAGPLYGFPEMSISASSASCVKCIHTDMYLYGTSYACGHIDFYPNGGTREQPGCKLFSLCDITNSCSHSRGDTYMGISVLNPKGFLSVKCNSWEDFKDGRCDRSVIIPMGKAAPCNV
nr:lipase member H-A-like isoform X2 [Nomia melanderi]